MREFAKDFYQSPAWRRAREYILRRDAGLCVRCGAIGEIVHHKVHLTPGNINNPEISLGEDNLETLCRSCHAIAHGAEPATIEGLAFDENGNLIPACKESRTSSIFSQSQCEKGRHPGFLMI